MSSDEEADNEVANILQDYIATNGIPDGKQTKSKFAKLTVTFKEKYQLGYHKYVFTEGHCETPKPHMK